jgi:hypothetical protein
LTHSIFDFVYLSQKRNDVDENDPKADDDHGHVAERGAEKYGRICGLKSSKNVRNLTSNNDFLEMNINHYATLNIELLSSMRIMWHLDAQYNDTQHNDTQHNDTQHNDAYHNYTQHADTQHNDNQHYDNHHNYTQHNDAQHK